VKKYDVFPIKNFGSFIAVSNTEDEFKSNVEALAEAIALCFSHRRVENGVVTSQASFLSQLAAQGCR
jgi:hypothetical protein